MPEARWCRAGLEPEVVEIIEFGEDAAGEPEVLDIVEVVGSTGHAEVVEIEEVVDGLHAGSPGAGHHARARRRRRGGSRQLSRPPGGGRPRAGPRPGKDLLGRSDGCNLVRTALARLTIFGKGASAVMPML